MMQFPNARIVLFAKAPEAGKVKTRLLPVVSAEEAAELYAELLKQTVEKMVRAKLAPLECWCSPDTSHPIFQSLVDDFGITLRLQQGADLGIRMERAAGETLTEVQSLVLIGGDCPALEPHHLSQAFGWLEGGVDAVVGPAEDGGYVLLGLKENSRLLFSDMPWGGNQVLRLTRERLQQLNWCSRELETLWDLDRPTDLERYRLLRE
ncbi:MAG: TIGR04282 family arsenosugar biosynthesis glycosyltransferase [Candidatus Sedimenticola sp. (ex Thyasira tokunagai)]